MKLVVGLGNPGPRYEKTRHNVGFMAVDMLGESLGVKVERKFGLSFIAEVFFKGEKLILAKPQCYMNRSGAAVSELIEYFKLSPEDLIVIHDDMDLELGRIRIRLKGSYGGHRGIKSIIENLGTQYFCRIKIGIGRPPAGVDPSDYVLSSFSGEEWEIVENAVERAGLAVKSILKEGAEMAMNKFNVWEADFNEKTVQETEK
ncbi:MAG TPA: aminoacyl-tRNA hydrolase [Peptococcaceae bacterium]|nr:MAG: Peptidyl-tRNA hydrolase [Clostridia bacterium 41_269]HBT20686.1 aminoacyl-tRNA hydrolase [Peptococcaceae bacterium]